MQVFIPIPNSEYIFRTVYNVSDETYFQITKTKYVNIFPKIHIVDNLDLLYEYLADVELEHIYIEQIDAKLSTYEFGNILKIILSNHHIRKLHFASAITIEQIKVFSQFVYDNPDKFLELSVPYLLKKTNRMNKYDVFDTINKLLNSYIKKISLGYIPIGEDDIDHFCDILNTSKVNDVKLRVILHSDSSETFMKNLGKVLIYNEYFKNFEIIPSFYDSLSQPDNFKNYFQYLYQAIAYNNNIEQISIPGDDLNVGKFIDILRLNKKNSIKRIILYGNELSNKGIMKIIDYVGEFDKIEELDLRGSFQSIYNKKAWTNIKKMLSGNRNLNKLWIGNENIVGNKTIIGTYSLNPNLIVVIDGYKGASSCNIL